MKKTTGIWIDHRQAVIVTVDPKGHVLKRVPSNIDKQLGRSDGIRSTTPYEAQKVPADDSRERGFTGHLETYYDAVISHISDSDALLILGPGEPKGELKKRLEAKGLDAKIAGIETVDKMTDNQLVAKVKEYFQKKK